MRKLFILSILLSITYVAFSNPVDKDLIAVKKGNKWGFINYSGKTVIPFKYQEVLAFEGNKALVKKNNKWGMIDKCGKYIIEPEFDSLVEYYYPYCLLMKDSVYCAYYNGCFIDSSHRDITDYGSNIYIVYNGCKCGYADTLGNKITDYKYDRCWWFSEGLAAVKVGEKVGFINEQGEMVIEPQYNNLTAFSEGLASLHNNGTWSVINKNNEVVYQSKNVLVKEFSEGLARAFDFGKKEEYYVNKKFEQASPSFPLDYNLSNFENGFANIIDKDNRYGVINRKGEIIVPVEYDYIFRYRDDSESDMFTVQMGDKVIYYDTLGNKLLKPRYDSAYYFSEGLAAVCLNGKCGYINKRNEIVIPFQYDEACTFYNGIAAVKQNGKFGFVNKEGKHVINFKYDDITYHSAYLKILDIKHAEVIEEVVAEENKEDLPVYIITQ